MLAALFARGALGLGELLDAAFRLLRLRFGAFVVLAGIFAVISAGFDYIGTMTGIGSIMSLMGAAVGIWQTATVLIFIFALLQGNHLSSSAALQAGRSKFWRMLGLNLLIGIIMGLAMLPGAFLLFAGTAFGPIGMAIGFVLMLIPVVYLGTRWCVAGQSLIGEEAGITEAMTRSWDLTRGHVWRCLGYYLLVGALSLLFLYLPLFLAGSLLGIVAPDLSGVVRALIYAVTVIVSAIWVPFSLIAFTLLYYDLRVRNEGLDLELQVAQFEEETSQIDEVGYNRDESQRDLG
jgi:hypothetical protein